MVCVFAPDGVRVCDCVPTPLNWQVAMLCACTGRMQECVHSHTWKLGVHMCAPACTYGCVRQTVRLILQGRLGLSHPPFSAVSVTPACDAWSSLGTLGSRSSRHSGSPGVARCVRSQSRSTWFDFVPFLVPSPSSVSSFLFFFLAWPLSETWCPLLPCVLLTVPPLSCPEAWTEYSGGPRNLASFALLMKAGLALLLPCPRQHLGGGLSSFAGRTLPSASLAWSCHSDFRKELHFFPSVTTRAVPMG